MKCDLQLAPSLLKLPCLQALEQGTLVVYEIIISLYSTLKRSVFLWVMLLFSLQ